MGANQTIQTILNRRSVRAYRPDPVDDQTLDLLLEAARRAPTSYNLQAYTLIVVRDEAVKRQFADLAGGQQYIAECPVFVAFCADVSRIQLAGAMHDREVNTDLLEVSLEVITDAALAGMCFSIAAESVGLGTVFIGSMRNDPLRAARLLDLPRGCFVAFGMCLGYPVEGADRQKPRFPLDLHVHRERYDGSKVQRQVSEYDEVLGSFLSLDEESRGKNSWSAATAKSFSTSARSDLRRQLEELGFGFE